MGEPMKNESNPSCPLLLLAVSDNAAGESPRAPFAVMNKDSRSLRANQKRLPMAAAWGD